MLLNSGVRSAMCLIVIMMFGLGVTSLWAEDDKTDPADKPEGLWNNTNFRGFGVGFSFMGVAVDPEDLNDWLETENYKEFESYSLNQTTLYWSFSRNFHCGVAFYRGDTGWLSKRIGQHGAVESDTIYNSRLELGGIGIIAEYKMRFGHDRWMFHAGGGLAAMNIELLLEQTVLDESTTITRYSASAAALQLNTGLVYYVCPFIGLDFELGLLAMNAEEIALGGVEEHDFPDIELGGAYLGFGLKLHM